MCVKGLWPNILRAKWESDQRKESGWGLMKVYYIVLKNGHNKHALSSPGKTTVQTGPEHSRDHEKRQQTAGPVQFLLT